MNTVRRAALCFVVLCAPVSVIAQPSTSAIGEGRSVAFEGAIGREFHRITGEGADRPAYAFTATVASGTDKVGGLRASAWYIQRGASNNNPYSASDVKMLVIGLAAEVRLRLGRGIALSPMVGYGYSPYVSSTRGKSTGKNWITGASLRWNHVYAEWAFIGLLGAENVVSNAREFYPLSIGVRY